MESILRRDDELDALLEEVRACTLCAASLPLGPRPILQAGSRARVLITGQAPGRRTHAAGIPFDDPSGDRLREWTGLTREVFYDPQRIAILPMGFCYPGSGKSGDLPPRAECARAWRSRLLALLPDIRLTLVIGNHARAWHLPDARGTLTEVIAGWRDHLPRLIPLPHPSPRNQVWSRRNPWFERELLPVLRQSVIAALSDPADGSR